MDRYSETKPSLIRWDFDNSYARLPEAFFTRVNPTRVINPRLVVFNHSLADSLGSGTTTLGAGDAADCFSGNELPAGSEPIAQAYAGHQFGNLARLGDGRAILLGEHITPSGERFDIQLKGAGPTPYSRRGDGRAALGPMLREYLISEAMHGLGIPTTRSLAVTATGDPVFREETLRGAILTRVAASHIRVGTFEYFAALGDSESLRVLADYTLRRHFPDSFGAENPALALLENVMERQASLIAQWMRVGFVHGVMNTDNMALSGETIDYGPCAFIDAYDPAAVFSSIDRNGRYAFGQQPSIAAWNLARFAEALLPILHPETDAAIEIANAALESFEGHFQEHWLTAMRGKIGLFNEEPNDDALIDELLREMHASRADYTHTFRNLRPHPSPGSPVKSHVASASFAPSPSWRQRWVERLARQPQPLIEAARLMNASNPAVIPRNHEVEAALTAANADDLAPFERLQAALRRPYEDEGQPASLLNPPPSGTLPCRTFCGT